VARERVEVAEEREARDAKECVKDVCHVAGAVRDAAARVVLRRADEARQRGAVDPGRAAQDAQRREDPP
jgi:hypothetical protein